MMQADLLARLRTALGPRYEVHRELGRGGMSHVYLASDEERGCAVVIKVLRPEVAAVLGIKRFVREIQVMARLAHSRVLPLTDAGAREGLTYYATPYVEGESLRDRLQRDGPLPEELAVAIARGVADALAHAHEHNVVHRDIKPANILLEGDEPVVADFGLARAVTVAGGGAITPAGVAVGTPEYMSPEQGAADVEIDGRSDVYSLGCVCYEMLVGRPPFTGTSASIMAQHAAAAPPRIATVRPDVSADLLRIVEAALAKDRRRRFHSAAMRDALARLSPATDRPGGHTPLHRTLLAHGHTV